MGKRKKAASGGKQICFKPLINVRGITNCNRDDVFREYEQRLKELLEARFRDHSTFLGVDPMDFAEQPRGLGRR